MTNKFLLVFSSLLLLLSCGTDDTTDYPIIPEITFEEYTLNRELRSGIPVDVFELTIGYLDGDGDIGMKNNEKTLPGSDDIKHVLFIDYLEEDKNGNFKKVVCKLGEDTTTKKYRVPYITPVGNNKSIKGIITTKVLPCPLPRDTVRALKFDIYIIDRQLHKSNVVSSPVIYYESIQ